MGGVNATLGASAATQSKRVCGVLFLNTHKEHAMKSKAPFLFGGALIIICAALATGQGNMNDRRCVGITAAPVEGNANSQLLFRVFDDGSVEWTTTGYQTTRVNLRTTRSDKIAVDGWRPLLTPGGR